MPYGSYSVISVGPCPANRLPITSSSASCPRGASETSWYWRAFDQSTPPVITPPRAAPSTRAVCLRSRRRDPASAAARTSGEEDMRAPSRRPTASPDRTIDRTGEPRGRDARAGAPRPCGATPHERESPPRVRPRSGAGAEVESAGCSRKSPFGHTPNACSQLSVHGGCRARTAPVIAPRLREPVDCRDERRDRQHTRRCTESDGEPPRSASAPAARNSRPRPHQRSGASHTAPRDAQHAHDRCARCGQRHDGARSRARFATVHRHEHGDAARRAAAVASSLIPPQSA